MRTLRGPRVRGLSALPLNLRLGLPSERLGFGDDCLATSQGVGLGRGAVFGLGCAAGDEGPVDLVESGAQRPEVADDTSFGERLAQSGDGLVGLLRGHLGLGHPLV